MSDMVAKGRHVVGKRQYGAENPVKRVLSESDVLAIRMSAKSCRELAREFNVSFVTISQVKSRRTWRHLPG
jgi:hypothetical protein